MEMTLQPPTRRCTASGKDLKPGDRFFGVLLADGPKLARQDFAVDHWSGPPTHSLAYWLGQLPLDDVPRRLTFDDDMLLQCYRQLDGTDDPAQVKLRYVLALLLMRRKRLRLEDEIADSAGPVMVFCDLKTGERSHVLDPRLSERDLQATQDEVFRLMDWN